MKTVEASGRLKLAAIDLDGTLLAPDLQISRANLEALQVLHDGGIQIVIASGRHYLSVRPILENLPLVDWIVTCQGGEVSNRERTEVLGRSFMPRAEVEVALAQAAKFDLSPIVYATNEVLIGELPNDNIAFYEYLSGLKPRRVSRAALTETNAFKVIGIGTASQIASAMAAPPVASIEQVQTHSRIAEFMPRTISKASGLQLLASRLGISPAEVVAFGDADNDIALFKWAGLSVAMAHGWPGAKRSATMISTAGPPETALARAIEMVLQTPATRAGNSHRATGAP